MGRNNKKVKGICHICNKPEKLTYEHLPPESCFNSERVKEIEFKKFIIIDGKNFNGMEYLGKQKGAGEYSLCEECNNKMGKLYVDEFKKWNTLIKGNINVFPEKEKEKGETREFEIEFYPLRVFKAIIAMFLSVNNEKAFKEYDKLGNFLLNKDLNDFPKNIKVFCYAVSEVSEINRRLQLKQIVDVVTSRKYIVSEISFKPSGYLLSYSVNDKLDFINELNIDTKKLVDITFFLEYSYNQKVKWDMYLPVFPTHMPYTADYRLKNKIYDERITKKEGKIKEVNFISDTCVMEDYIYFFYENTDSKIVINKKFNSMV